MSDARIGDGEAAGAEAIANNQGLLHASFAIDDARYGHPAIANNREVLGRLAESGDPVFAALGTALRTLEASWPPVAALFDGPAPAQ